MKAQRRILARAHRQGWADDDFLQYDELNQQIKHLVAWGRQETLRHWKESMQNTKTAASWIQDSLARPAVVAADLRAITEQGLAVLEEWLPRWTQTLDDKERQASAAILCQQMHTYNLTPWTNPGPWTPKEVRSFCNASAAGLGGLPFHAFAQLGDDILQLFCQLFDAFDAGLAFPSCWTSARLACVQKPDGGTRPITILSAAYRIWAKRAVQNLACWTIVGFTPNLSVAGHQGHAQQILPMKFQALSVNSTVILNSWPVLAWILTNALIPYL